VRAGTDAGRTWVAEGHGRRLIFCTRNRTDPISGLAKNGDTPGFSASFQQSRTHSRWDETPNSPVLATGWTGYPYGPPSRAAV